MASRGACFWSRSIRAKKALAHDRRHVGSADRRLRHRGRVDIELYRRTASTQQAGLEAGRNVEHEGAVADIHRAIDDGTIDGIGPAKMGLERPVMNARQERGLVGSDDCDRRIGDIGLDSRGCRRSATTIADKYGQDFVVAKACRFLQAEHVGQSPPHRQVCGLRHSRLAATFNPRRQKSFDLSQSAK